MKTNNKTIKTSHVTLVGLRNVLSFELLFCIFSFFVLH
jgi:hypothetical protein